MENTSLVEKSQEDRTAISNNLIKNYVLGTMGMGLVPIPIIDYLGIGALQLRMIAKLANSYDLEFSENRTKSIISSLVGGAAPFLLAQPVASLMKFVPVIGPAFGGMSMTITAGATTYALGRVFALHFESGGTLLNFNVESMKDKFSEKFEEGKEVASTMKEEATSEKTSAEATA